jgi:electron transport complex protein RnfD
MWAAALGSFLAVMQSSMTDSFASLILALSALAAALGTEFVITWRTRGFEALKDGSAAVSAMALVLFLPNRLHPVYAVFGAIFATAVIKHSFGGLGSNWINPAAGGWLFIRSSWPGAFNAALRGSPLSVISEGLEAGLVSIQGSPMGILKIAGNGVPAGRIDGIISSVLNGTVFMPVKAELPSGYIDLFLLRAPGIIADRGLAALLLGTIVVLAFQACRTWVPLVYLLVYTILVRVAGGLPFGGSAGSGDMLFGLFSGGLTAAAFFFAAEPVSGAKSYPGVLAGAVLTGFFSWLFRYQGSEPYGAVLAVLTVNAVSVIARGLEFRYLYSRGLRPGGGNTGQGRSIPG